VVVDQDELGAGGLGDPDERREVVGGHRRRLIADDHIPGADPGVSAPLALGEPPGEGVGTRPARSASTPAVTEKKATPMAGGACPATSGSPVFRRVATPLRKDA